MTLINIFIKLHATIPTKPLYNAQTGGFSSFYTALMPNNTLNIRTQIELLTKRGMTFSNTPRAERYLLNISYYRLKAYWYPYRDLSSSEENFKGEVDFDDILNTYIFDRKLKLILFDAIERIEIALRTKLVYYYSNKHGEYFYREKKLFKNETTYQYLVEKIKSDIGQSKEEFLKHHKEKYNNEMLQAWKYFELVTFGRASNYFNNLSDNGLNKKIAEDFGLKNYKILASWLASITYSRNIIAHHGRLWNKILTIRPKKPNSTKILLYPFIRLDIDNSKLFYQISCMLYLIKTINPSSSIVKQLTSLFDSYPNIPLSKMGFTKEWREEKLWK